MSPSLLMTGMGVAWEKSSLRILKLGKPHTIFVYEEKIACIKAWKPSLLKHSQMYTATKAYVLSELQGKTPLLKLIYSRR